LPSYLSFLRTPTFEVAMWIKVLCATTIALGIGTGGMRIIRTVGKKLTRLQKSQGFAAQAAGAAVIQSATLLGIPLSTTHVISSSIMGVGATKRLNAVKWRVMGRIVWAWVLTIPVTASLGYGLFHGFRLLGIQGN
jgi:PiT family inorganic phosphate transporter